MENNLLKVPSVIEKVMTMADGGLRLFVDTQELQPEDKGVVMNFHKKQGYFVFSEQYENINVEDIKNLPKIELEEGEKSPSIRLRAVLYVYWEEKKVGGSFDSFYKKQMERFIQTIKEKLN